MDSSEKKESSITCEDCDFIFAGMELYEQHLRGKHHVKRSKRKQRLTSRRSVNGDPVGIYSNILTADPHDQASRREHLKSQKEELEKIGGKVSNQEPEDSIDCKVCVITFPDITQYKLHMCSKSHKRAVRLNKLKGLLSLNERQCQQGEISHASRPNTYGCTLCDKQFTEPEVYFQHMQSKCHKKRVSLQKIFNRINEQLTDSDEDGESERANNRSSQTSGRQRSFTATTEVFECNYCAKIFTEAVPFARHLASKLHERQRRKNSLLAELKDLLAEESEDCSSSSEGQDDDRTSSC